MTADPISVGADGTLETAKVLMAAHRIHHLPVVEDERAVGMVGLRDVVRREITPMAIGGLKMVGPEKQTFVPTYRWIPHGARDPRSGRWLR